MNVSAFASATQASIARAETPASNIALDLIMRFPRGRLPLSGRLSRKPVHSGSSSQSIPKARVAGVKSAQPENPFRHGRA